MELNDMNFVDMSSSIAGRVVDPDGNPVAEARISVFEAGSDQDDYEVRRLRRNFNAQFSSEDDPKSDLDGYFFVDGLPENAKVEVNASLVGSRHASTTALTGAKDVKIILDSKLKATAKFRN
jgi:hypothetical protein